MCNVGFGAQTVRTVILLLLSAGLCRAEELAKAKPTATILPSGDVLELEYDGGSPQKITIPVYRAGNIRYFIAGVGLEERRASYPPFALKLVLVAGEKPYLSHVNIKVLNASQEMVVSIPKEQVLGPWVFIDLPAGTYEVTATWEGRTLTQEQVRATPGVSRTLNFRWPMKPDVTR